MKEVGSHRNMGRRGEKGIMNEKRRSKVK